MKFLLTILLAGAALSALAGEPLPIDPLWQSAEFRKAFTASYGVDARIEPRLTTQEKAVLDAVADEMADKDRDGAIEKLTGSSLLGKSPALIFTLGNLRFEEGKLDDAAENFAKAVNLYPNFRDAHRNLAVALVQTDDFAKAEPHLRRAIELGAADGVTFGLLGYCHAMAGRHQAALQAYRRAQLTMPEETQWQVGEAEALTALGDHAAAESLFGSLLLQRPKDMGLWLRQADVWIRSSQPEKAMPNLEFVRRMGELNVKDLVLLGELFCQKRMRQQAGKCMEEAYDRSLTSDDRENNVLGDAVDGLASLCRYGYYAEAKYVFENAIAGYASTAQLQIKVSRVKGMIELGMKGGNAAEGLELLQSVIENDPLDAEALLVLAGYHARTGSRDEAMMLFEQAAKVDASRAQALMAHGRLLVDDGDYATGLKLIEESLALEPRAGMEEYLEVLRKLAKAAE